MHRLTSPCGVLVVLLVQALSAQTSVKTIEDGALDKIELFVPSLDSPTNLTVLIRPFDASAADLGTGDKDGKDARQQEAQTMKSLFGEKFVTSTTSVLPSQCPRESPKRWRTDDERCGT